MPSRTTAFLSSPIVTTRRHGLATSTTTRRRRASPATPTFCMSASPSFSSRSPPPTAARVLRLERALAAAVEQERYSDAATLRDALQAARTSDPLLSKRAELSAAVASEDFTSAARLRDELATLTERCARGEQTRQVDRIVILKGKADPEQTLRVATVSPDGDLALPLLPTTPSPSIPTSYVSSLNDGSNPYSTDSGVTSGIPRVFLQPTWSPTGDYIAMTEIGFHIDASRVSRGVAVAEAESRLVIMNALDGSILKSVSLKKPPFFFFWSPDGKCVTLLSNDPTSTVSTIALSAIQVVADRGGAGLDTQSITGPVASGHPLLYDFNPRDSSRIVVHMGDCDTVAVMKVSTADRTRRVLTSIAGTFGTPQWHPSVGKDGREVVLFVEAEESDDDESSSNENNEDEAVGTVVNVGTNLNGNEENDEKSESANPADGTFEKFVSNGTSLLESVIRKGAESLGWTGSNISSNDVNSVADKIQQLEDKLRNLINSSNSSSSKDSDDDDSTSGNDGDNDGSIIVQIISSEDDDDFEGDELADLENLDLVDDGKSLGLGVDGKKWIVASLDANEGGIRSKNLSERIKNEIEKKLKERARRNQSKQKMQRLIMCDVDRPELRRTITRFSGVMAFKLSSDGKSLATLITNPLSGDDELTIRSGDFTPDSVVEEDEPEFRFPFSRSLKQEQNAADIILSTPSSRVLAFFWSPDSRKLLFLSSMRNSTLGAAQWATFDLDTSKVVRYEKFIMSGIYIHCLNFFDQFAMSMTPWSPDSKRFCYPGRPLSKKELEKDDSGIDMSAGNSPALSALLVQKDNVVITEQKQFVARVQKVPDTSSENGGVKVKPEPARTIVDNVEYACWSPC